MTILITGGSGFIGSNFIKIWINNFKTRKIINLDKLSYASNNIQNLPTKNYKFIKGNIGNINLVKKILYKYQPDVIINFAAETHVDTSISNPKIFAQNNIMDFLNFIETCKCYWENTNQDKKEKFRFIQISTDEIYGSLKENEKPFTENSRYKTNNPYSASKASANHIAQSFFQTYDFPIIITISTNNYGPYQHTEKFIPKIIKSAIQNTIVPIYGDGQQIRDWLYVKDHCNALIKIIKYGIPGESYNIGANNEITNLELAILLCEILDKIYPNKNCKSYKTNIRFINDRPGHDTRYSLDSTKIQTTMQWKPIEKTESGIYKTVNWYLKKMKHI
ncbi:MAG: dTDP-glucose 4,6-dehydratase [Candidatus Kinetoplastibacterium crithidii]|nr:MAG: dTDP-glucose 4,6-dehydratase [Candidatus Kinetoplastibacterium crithidii]